MKEETTADTDKSAAEIDFSKLLLDEIYVIQQAAVAKLRKEKHHCLRGNKKTKEG